LRSAIKGKAPSLDVERRYWDQGRSVVVGIDEVGRGAWAGPISVGAAVVPAERRVYKIRDSKLLTEPEREAIFERVADWVEAFAVGHASPSECDELGMSEAQKLAAQRAIAALPVEPDALILDGNWDFVGGASELIVGGDAKSLSISAASILAKVTRDRVMRTEADSYPWYWFEGNKGYPGPRHKAALQAVGPSAIHRRSWVFMDHLPWGGVTRYRRPDPQVSLFDV
jgi:ribonuclease HII